MLEPRLFSPSTLSLSGDTLVLYSAADNAAMVGPTVKECLHAMMTQNPTLTADALRSVSRALSGNVASLSRFTAPSNTGSTASSDDWYWYDVIRKADALLPNGLMNKASATVEALCDYCDDRHIPPPAKVMWTERTWEASRRLDPANIKRIAEWAYKKTRACMSWLDQHPGEQRPRGRRTP